MSKLFGKNLKRILYTLGLSQIELAEKTGLTAAAISQIINGKREPSLRSIVKIMRALSVKFEILIKE